MKIFFLTTETRVAERDYPDSFNELDTYRMNSRPSGYVYRAIFLRVAAESS